MDYEKMKQVCFLKKLDSEEIRLILNCLDAREQSFEKGAVIFDNGEQIEEIGVVLTGKVSIERNDYWGNRFIVAMVSELDVFGETYACLGLKSEVQVIAAEKTKVLFLQINRMMTTCSSSCPFHNQLIQNLMQTCAKKNYQLSEKIDILSRRTTREKLLAYLSHQAIRQGSQQLVIPLNRQQLADYLSVDRSAMTVELGKLKKEGIIDFEKHQFQIL